MGVSRKAEWLERVAVICFLGLMILRPTVGFATEPCPDVSVQDTKEKWDANVSLSLISKLLSSVGLGGGHEHDVTSRMPAESDQILQLFLFKVDCELIVKDHTLSTADKVHMLREETAAYFLIKNGPQVRTGPRTDLAPSYRDRYGQPPSVQLASFSVAIADGPSSRRPTLVADQLPPPVSSPPQRGATIIRVFPKKNIDLVGVVKLARLLPGYDVRIGSSEVSHGLNADTLFVDRDQVSEDKVIQVLTVLHGMGVAIKSIQQDQFSRSEIQVGTILGSHNQSAFDALPVLDVRQLSSLTGVAFWKAGFNGVTFCTRGVGHAQRCPMTADARPDDGNYVHLTPHLRH